MAHGCITQKKENKEQIITVDTMKRFRGKLTSWSELNILVVPYAQCVFHVAVKVVTSVSAQEIYVTKPDMLGYS